MFVISAIVAALVLSEKMTMWRVKSTCQWELDEEKLVSRDDSGRTTEIALREIKSLRESPGWLVVYGGEPPRQINVPSQVNDFEDLKGNLIAHCSISTRKRRTFGSLRFAPFALGMIVYGFLFLSHNRAAVIASGVLPFCCNFWRLTQSGVPSIKPENPCPSLS